MKKVFMLFVLILSVLHYQLSFAQVKEGKIIYDISYPESGLDNQTLAMLPTESSSFFKNDMMRIDMKMGLGMNNTILINNSKKEVHLLMDMMGQKMQMQLTEKDIDKQIKDEGEYSITEQKDTKQIAGYLCNKALVSTKDGKNFSVWYTKDIQVKDANWNNQFKKINGFMMEFRMNQNGLTMEMTAREVLTDKVNDEVFKIADGYKTMSKDDLKRMSQGK